MIELHMWVENAVSIKISYNIIYSQPGTIPGNVPMNIPGNLTTLLSTGNGHGMGIKSQSYGPQGKGLKFSYNV